jgi:RNA polymerase sigma-70 factor (ECF subfamily)
VNGISKASTPIGGTVGLYSANRSTTRAHWFNNNVLPIHSELRQCAQRYSASADCDADDLLHDAFARVMQMEKLLSIDSPKAFLGTLIRNLAIDQNRRRATVHIETVADIDDERQKSSAPDLETIVHFESEWNEIIQIIAGLPPQCRTVFTLRRVYGLSRKEIAKKLNLSVSTIEKHITKGTRVCQEKMRRFR